MNDDLESQLARWRPADPPPDLLRRLRAAAPPARAGGIWPVFAALIRQERPIPWPRIAAGFAVIMVMASAGWIVFSAPPAEMPTRAGDRAVPSLPRAPEQDGRAPQAAHFAGGGGETPAGTPPDLSLFVRSGLRYAVLDASLDANSISRLPLDAPVGPMRLDCGYASPVRELGGYPFSPFHFNARDQF